MSRHQRANFENLKFDARRHRRRGHEVRTTGTVDDLDST